MKNGTLLAMEIVGYFLALSEILGIDNWLEGNLRAAHLSLARAHSNKKFRLRPWLTYPFEQAMRVYESQGDGRTKKLINGLFAIVALCIGFVLFPILLGAIGMIFLVVFDYMQLVQSRSIAVLVSIIVGLFSYILVIYIIFGIAWLFLFLPDLMLSCAIWLIGIMQLYKGGFLGSFGLLLTAAPRMIQWMFP